MPEEGVATPVRNRPLLTLGVMLATIMQILDTTIANVALPHMQASLDATNDQITWVLTSYIIAVAISIPITGWLSDRIGSRNLFIGSVIVFVIASALCGMAQGLVEMVAFRILQGIAAAFLGPLAQTVLLDINPPARQVKATTMWATCIMIGPIMGPVIGGWLTDNFNWRWVFYVNLPIGAICIALLWALLPSRPIRIRRFDIFGFATLALALASLQLLLDRGQTEDWFQSGEIWIEAIVASSACWIFIVHMLTARQPMFDRRMFRDANFVTAMAFLLVMGLIMMATMALLPTMLQTIYGHSVFDTGLLLMPRGAGVVVTTQLASFLLGRKVDPRWLVGIGFTVAAWSMWSMTSWSLEMDSTPVQIAGFIQGAGIGLVFTPLNIMAFGTLPAHFRTEGASMLNLTRSLGASAGISLVTTLLSRNIQTSHAALSAEAGQRVAETFDPAQVQVMGGAGSTVFALADAEINRQAAMIGYLNDFYLMAIVTALAVPLVVFLKAPKGDRLRPDPSAAGSH